MSEITKHVGELLKQARKKKGLTQKEVGQRLGIAEATYNRYEKGNQNLTLETLEKVAIAIGVDLRILVE